MSREDEIVDFIKRNGPQWKRDLIRRLRGKSKSDAFLDGPLRKALEKERLTTLPRPNVGPNVIYLLPGTEPEALEKWKRKLEYDPHGIRLKGLKVIGIDRRMIPDLNDDVYYALLLQATGTMPIESARFRIEVSGEDGTIHRQSGLWDYDDCVPPNPTKLPFAVGEIHGIDLFRVTPDMKAIRFPIQQPGTTPGDWEYVEFPFNTDYLIVATPIVDGHVGEPVSKRVSETIDESGPHVPDGEAKALEKLGFFKTSGLSKIIIPPIRKDK